MSNNHLCATKHFFFQVNDVDCRPVYTLKMHVTKNLSSKKLRRTLPKLSCRYLTVVETNCKEHFS